jgi:ubiquinone/menaquinone biosynthesis C-methylase UbiE
MSTVMSGLPGYALSDSASELDRLRMQARFWEPDAEAMLRLIGVRPGWRCLDLGCGAMGILRSLSQAVGPEGSVIGLDNHPRLLAAARKWADAQPGMENVSLVEGDAFRTGLPRASFDLVHARFMFCPLGTSDALLREMLALTKPGGVIALQEPIASSWRFYPSRPQVERLIAAILSAFQSGGGNFDAGAWSFPMLRSAGLDHVQTLAIVRALQPGDPFRRLPVQFAASLKQRILDEGLLDEEQLGDLMLAAEAAAADDHTLATTFTLMQAWGQKAA